VRAGAGFSGFSAKFSTPLPAHPTNFQKPSASRNFSDFHLLIPELPFKRKRGGHVKQAPLSPIDLVQVRYRAEVQRVLTGVRGSANESGD
jgi:hypothetical protein